MNYSPSSRLASDIYPLIRRLKLPTVFQELLAGRGGRPITGLTSLLAWRCPVRGAASRPVKPQRRLSRTFARNGPPRCGCPIHASFVRSGPVSWDAYGRCGCGLLPVETLEPLEGCPSFRRRAARRTSGDHPARSLPPSSSASLGGEGYRCMHPRLPSLRPSGPRPFPPALCPPVQEPLVDTPHRSTRRGRSFAAGRCIMIATPR